MGRLKLDILCLTLALVVVNCVVQCQYYVERPKPIYIVEGEDNADSLQEGSEEYEALPQDQFMSRSGATQEAEDSDEDEESDEDVGRQGNLRPNGRAPTLNLPKDFNANVKRQMRIPPRSRAPLHGDPSPIQEDDDDGRRPESRLLWPFSIEITKGDKGGKGWGHDGPSHHGSYTSWASSNGWVGGAGGPGGGSPGGWGSYSAHPYNHNYGWEEEKGLTDEEILKSKHYKKYQKKKKKKIKKLKKKLKFKRLIQKILQKHITYLDKIAPY